MLENFCRSPLHWHLLQQRFGFLQVGLGDLRRFPSRLSLLSLEELGEAFGFSRGLIPPGTVASLPHTT